ncbi:hypothetical protein GEMRC1_007370 [Eukaryota sp. GEM-RC1]
MDILNRWQFKYLASHKTKTLHNPNAYNITEERQKVARDALLATTKEIKGLLNKLSDANHESILNQLYLLLSGHDPISRNLSPQQLAQTRTVFAELLYKKAVSEPTFIDLYCRLCKALTHRFDTIAHEIINQCRLLFESFFVHDASLSDQVGQNLQRLKKTLATNNHTPSDSQLKAEQFFSEEKLKSQLQTNMQLAASLLLHGVISVKVANFITDVLIRNYQKRFAVEALITFWSKILDRAPVNGYIESLAVQISRFSKDKNIVVREQRQKVARDALLAAKKEIKGQLNKLSDANHESILNQLYLLLSGHDPISRNLSPQQLAQTRTVFAELLYKKAVSEPTFIDLYCRLCKALTHRFDTIAHEIINQCRLHFESFFVHDASLSDQVGQNLQRLKKTLATNNHTPSDSQLKAEQFFSEEKLKSQLQTNMQLAASLLLHGVISVKVANFITDVLIRNYQKRFAVEALITFWSKILDRAPVNGYIESLAVQISRFSKDKNIVVREQRQKVARDALLATTKEIKGLLNKLSDANHESILNQLYLLLSGHDPISRNLSPQQLAQTRTVFAELLYKKAVSEPTFIDLYCRLCKALTHRFDTIAHEIINQCRLHFESFFVHDASLSDQVGQNLQRLKKTLATNNHTPSDSQLKAEQFFSEEKLKSQLQTNMQLAASLLLHGVISVKVANFITDVLIRNYQKRFAVEALITFWSKILDRAPVNGYIESLAVQISRFSKDKNIVVREQRQKVARDALLATTKEIKGLLNKLSDANHESILNQLYLLLSGHDPISRNLSPQQLAQTRTVFAELLYKKAVSEPTFIDLYCRLCKALTHRFDTIAHEIINQCRLHFESFFVHDASLSDQVGQNLQRLKKTLATNNHTPSDSQLKAEQFFSEEKLKSQLQTNMQLAASLLLHGVISVKVANFITDVLIRNYQKRFAVEALITFWSKILDRAPVNGYIESLAVQISRFSKDKNIVVREQRQKVARDALLATTKEIKGLLNKLSDANHESILNQLYLLLSGHDPISRNLSPQQLAQTRTVFAELLYKKAVSEPTFIDLYCRLCKALTHRFDTIAHEIINQCRLHFESFFVHDASLSDQVGQNLQRLKKTLATNNHTPSDSQLKAEQFFSEEKLKSQLQTNMQLAASLLLHGVISVKVANFITDVLIRNYQKRFAVEALITFWSKILDRAPVNGYIESLAVQISRFSKDKNIVVREQRQKVARDALLATTKEIKGLLNKLSDANHESILNQLYLLLSGHDPISRNLSPQQLAQTRTVFAELLYKKAVSEPTFIDLYCRLCKALTHRFDTIAHEIINQCRLHFESFFVHDASLSDQVGQNLQRLKKTLATNNHTPSDSQLKAEQFFSEEKLKSQLQTNMQLAASLLLHGVISVKVANFITAVLIRNYQKRFAVEALITFCVVCRHGRR